MELWSDFRNALRVVQQLEIELLRTAVIAIQLEDFADDAASWLSLDLDDQIDGLSDLGLHVLKGCLGVAAEDEVRKSSERLYGRICVNRSERSGMSGVERIKQGSRFDSAHFGENDAVGPPA